MFDWTARLKTFPQIDNDLRQTTSISGREKALKNKNRILVLGLGWEDWHHPWSAEGHEFAGEELAEHIKNLMKGEKKRKISAKPPVDMPTRKKITVLGTISPDIIRLDAKKTAVEGKVIESAEVLKE